MSATVPPALPLAAWEDTKTTLHLYAQVVGKVRLACAPPRNHWWHVPLYVDVDGLTTRRMHHDGTTFRIDLDILAARLRVRTADGRDGGFDLVDGLSVAAFDRGLREVLAGLGIHVDIVGVPFGVPMTTPFAEDEEHRSYDAAWARTFWEALDWVDRVFEEFAGWSTAKTTPVHMFWHSFDLAVTRFSGRPAPPLPDADPVTREAYSHEVISFGFWAGDQRIPEASFYAYAAPEPAGMTARPLRPAAAAWADEGGMALLPYEAVRAAADPRRALLGFLQSAYEAGADAAGWDRAALASSWSPPPEELDRLG